MQARQVRVQLVQEGTHQSLVAPEASAIMGGANTQHHKDSSSTRRVSTLAEEQGTYGLLLATFLQYNLLHARAISTRRHHASTGTLATMGLLLLPRYASAVF
jgi:hypothetical protein